MAHSPFRAQLHCVQSRSVSSEMAHLCGHLNGVIWGAQEIPPFTSKILLTAAVHLSFAFKVLSPPGWHRNADTWHYCSSFFHYHINMDEFTQLDRSPTGNGGIENFKNLICIFGVEKWKSSRMLGWVSQMSGGLGWLGEVHPKWEGECQNASFPDVTVP